MNAQNTRLSFPNLDIAKIVMAFLVVEIHTKPFKDIDSAIITQVVSGIECVAVPFFFIASGFLCFRGLSLCDFANKSSSAAARVRNTIRKQLSLYVIWSVLLLPLALFGAHLNGWGLLKTVALLIRGLLFVGENAFTWPLWYLLASVVGFSLVYLFLRGGVSPKSIVAVSTFFLLLGYAIQALYGWADTPELIKFLLDAYYLVFVTVRNGLFEGFFYVAIGMFIGFNWGMQRTWRPVITYACLFAGLFGCITISSSAHLPFCAMFALSLFMLCIRRVGKASHPWARKASTVVYLVHMVFVIIFVYGIYGFTETSFLSADIPHTMLYIFALSCSLLVAAIVIPASRKSAMLKTVFGV